MKRAVCVATFLLLTVLSSSAQSLDGRWTTNLRARDGQTITLTLKSDGTNLTGTIFGFRTIPLEGSLDGNRLKVTLRVPTATGGELRVTYIGVVEGREIKFTHQSDTGRAPVFGPNAREFVATPLQ